VLKNAYAQLAAFRTDVLEYDEDARIRKIWFTCDKNGEPILLWDPHGCNALEMVYSTPDAMRLIEDETGLKTSWIGPNTAPDAMRSIEDETGLKTSLICPNSALLLKRPKTYKE
jgi:hypothetical protein